MKAEEIDFKKGQGLIPVIIQNAINKDVLMLGYMNEEAFLMTQKSGWVHFWSRERKKLWMKGEESGNKLKVERMYLDCDSDTLLIEAKLCGTSVCHSGNYSCFFDK
jgi:phosphoribosyl-AMP cyclohydrolase